MPVCANGIAAPCLDALKEVKPESVAPCVELRKARYTLSVKFHDHGCKRGYCGRIHSDPFYMRTDSNTLETDQ